MNKTQFVSIHFHSYFQCYFIFLLIFLLSTSVLSAPRSADPNFCDFHLEYSYYELCYSIEHRQALWAEHILSVEQIKGRQGRTNDFKSDLRINNPVNPKDYKGSGYDRGHLVPAADMKLNVTSMSETFYMTNMSPQNSKFNSGIWNALEGHLRNEVLKIGPAVIITAPVILKSESYVQIPSGVSIPNLYYKIAYFYEAEMMKAYLIPNKAMSGKKFSEFKTSVDEIEQLTDIDFFSELSDPLEQKLESIY